ncbi:MAG: hypothetical protein OXL34_05155 [Gemmatimonadota bacterium]|nr:hypothetical protein [Gemmatimonadota bacterium]
MKTIVQRTLPLAVTMLVLACADLAMESDRIPESMEISTNSVLITKGETTKLDVVVRDQNGEVMELPSWAPLEWRLEDPAIAEVALDGTVSTLRGGETRVWVSLADLGAAARVRVNPDQVLLSAPLIYVTQSTQNHDGDVRLVAGRRAMVRVFMVGNETSFYGPGVRIRVLLDGDEIFHQVFPPVRDRTPEEVIESEVDGSVNAEIPGSVIRPGIRMVVELDPEGVVPLAPGSQLRYPAEGSIPLQVVELQPFRHVIVPTVSPTTGNTSVVSWANTLHADHPYMSLLKSLWPISGTELEIHETYSTSSIDTFNGWFSWLADIRTIFHQEGRRGYYYGATHQSAQGLLGVGYFGVPASIGVNRADTHTHEVGHNLNLRHAPGCGAGGPDPNFPYSGGGIGVWGYDLFRNTLKDPREYLDVMTYCDRVWVSDYNFDLATRHRLGGDGGYIYAPPAAAAASDPTGEMLVVRGQVLNGEITLDPAFVVTGPPALPESDGPYRVDGIGVDGQTEFSLSFTPDPMEYGGGGFVFLLPYEPEWAETLDRMVLTGPEGTDTVTRSSGQPMAVVTDPSNGQIRAIIRDWAGEALPGEGVNRVEITRGIPTGARR